MPGALESHWQDPFRKVGVNLSSNAIIFISLCVVLSGVSFALDRGKTLTGFKRGWKMFKNVLLPFLNILILISVMLYFIPPSRHQPIPGREFRSTGLFNSGAGRFDHVDSRLHFLSYRCRSYPTRGFLRRGRHIHDHLDDGGSGDAAAGD